MKHLLFLFFGVVMVSSSCAQKQTFRYQRVPYDIRSKVLINENARMKLIASTPNLFDLTKMLPLNYTKDGTVDYTSYIQQGINAETNVILPNFPIMVNYNGLKLRSNQTLIFNKNSKLILQKNSKTNYQIISINSIQNVKVYYANIVGDRKNHLDNKGEWGMGIDIRLSKNITLINPTIIDCWGDGICIGASTPSENVVIKNAFLDNNRRNGLTVGSVKGLQVTNFISANTNGARPMAGIDIEPNNNNDIIENLVFDNVYTYNNQLRGLLVAILSLKGNNPKLVTMTFNNHIDIGSNHAIGLSLKGKNIGQDLTGSIVFNNPIWRNNSKDFIQNYDLNDNKVQVLIKNPKVTNQYLNIKDVRTLTRGRFSTNSKVSVE